MTEHPAPARVTLEGIRGHLERARANARTVAALVDNPGCSRRRVLDAAGVRPHELAQRLGHPATRGQSPFAITSGNRFEHRLKKGSDYALLVEALRQVEIELPLPSDGLIVENLGRAPGDRIGQAWLEKRAERTRQVLGSIARAAPRAPHVVDHPVLVFDLAGTPVYLEPDALAFRVGSELELVEIKSYAVIDDQADASKVAATAAQSAVYLLALKATLKRLALEPSIVRDSVILVAPRNFGRTPGAFRIPLRKKVMALQRVLGAVPRTSQLLDGLPDGFTLDTDPHTASSSESRQRLDDAVKQLPMLYVPECLASCDMAKYCRRQALDQDSPSRLGRMARDELAGLARLSDALRLAHNGPRGDEAHLTSVARGLQDAYSVLQRARARVPDACGLASGPVSVKRAT